MQHDIAPLLMQDRAPATEDMGGHVFGIAGSLQRISNAIAASDLHSAHAGRAHNYVAGCGLIEFAFHLWGGEAQWNFAL